MMSSDERTDRALCSCVSGEFLRGTSSSLCMPKAAAHGHPLVDVMRMQFSGQACHSRQQLWMMVALCAKGACAYLLHDV